MANPQGVDVASYQGYPRWRTVKAAGYDFAITKATEGVNYVNPYFERNWHEIGAEGMYRGAYHYARPNLNGPQYEAGFFADVVISAGLKYGDLMALDIEEGSGNLDGWVFGFLDHLSKLVGFDPIIYTSAGFIQEHGINSKVTGERFGLWLASWRETMPPAPDPWKVVAFWQKSASGQVPGIDGLVDLNEFNGPAERIPLYGYQGGEKPGEPPPPISGEKIAIAHLCDVVVPMATHDPVAALAEAKRIRAQYLGG